MSDCNSCPSKGVCGKDKNACMIENNPLNRINNVIGVMSGKGGVGKSTISVLTARFLRGEGYRVGILDADITGPSIPRLLGLKDKKAVYKDQLIMPVKSEEDIKVMSLNFLIEDENEPVVWRGPVISGAVKQFWTDVLWEELDYLIIDMPPGTGDVALTVMQSLPINGVVMVSVPQDLVSMIVTKAVNMARKMEIPILGVIENMAYIKCPHCGEKISLYEGEGTQSFLTEMDIRLLGELPMLGAIANISSGNYEKVEAEIHREFKPITENILRALDVIKKK